MSTLDDLYGRCATCEHWNRFAAESEVARHGNHAGKCDCDRFIYDEYPQVPQDGLRYWDYEDYGAGFETGELFGCIHWRLRRFLASND